MGTRKLNGRCPQITAVRLEGAWLVCAADKVNNMTATLRDYEAVGDAVWERFNAGREGQLWWYGACAEVLERRVGGGGS